MNRLVIGVTVVWSAATAAGIAARESTSQSPGATWKNVQVLTELKSEPDIALYDTMDFVAASLGVGCDTCHAGQFEADTKPTKLRAREMMKMTRAINDSTFGGRTVITCFTCHQGHETPTSVPTPWHYTPDELVAMRTKAATPAKAPALPAPAPTLPTADEVLTRYRSAVGVSSLHSLHMAGTFSGAFTAGKVDIVAVYPDQVRVSLVATIGLTTNQILNHDHGWTTSPGSRAALPDAQRQRLMADIAAKIMLPPALFQTSRMVVTGVEPVSGHDCYVVEADTPTGLERLDFDRQSGLLLKLRRDMRTPLGTSARETEWSDYRDVTGVKRAFTVTDHLMGNEQDYTFTTIETDVPVDASIFEPPPPKAHVAVRLSTETLDAVTGRYQLGPTRILTVTREGNQLFATQPVGPKIELTPESDLTFFVIDAPIEVTFVKGANGHVTSLTIHQAGATLECPRVK